MSSSNTSFTTQIRFARALSVVRSLPDRGALQPTATEKLNLYGLYKQAIQGDCNMSRPSSKHVGRYAKWKAWERRRGISPVEAQKLYVNALIELLVEFIHRYPDHEQAPSLSESLHYIELSDDSNEDEPFVDAWDPEDAEKEEYYLAHLGPHQLEERQLDLSSPEQRYHGHNNNPDTPSLATFASSTNNSTYPETPELSPHYSQQHQKYWHRNGSKYARPIDFLAHGANSSVASDTDTVDREVAAATASLALQSPNYHPYVPTNTTTLRKSSVDKTNSSTVTPSTAAVKSSSDSNDSNNDDRNHAPPVSERALESLQTEVTALSEQIDRLTRGMVARDERQRQLRWSWFRLIKSILKHTVINSIVLLLVFLILWRRKSPVALAIVSYVGPQTQEIMRYLVRRIVFWKVTV